MSETEGLAARLEAARLDLETLTATAEELSASRHEYETDMAIVSGIRRKPNARADARRFARFDRQAEAWAKVREQAAEVERLAARLAHAERTKPVPFTEDELAAARYVRDRNGWHEVARVNTKSVSVKTPWSWTDRITRDRILEVRAA